MILGRQVEQDLLNRFLARLLSGDGWTLVVVGEIGIGKTTLLDWVCETGQGPDHGEIAVLRAGGRESEADLPGGSSRSSAATHWLWLSYHLG